MQVIKYAQLPYHFNVAKLQKEVSNLLLQNWQLHYQKLHYEGDWSALPLRSINGNVNDIYILPNNDQAYNDTIFLASCPYIKEVLSEFKCNIKNVRLLKLNAGAIIKDHTDSELNYENGEIRIHIPIITHKNVLFYLQDELMQIEEGQCWYMNFNLPHRIENKSNIDRIHLVIDAVVNDWVKNLFTSNALLQKKEIDIEENNYSEEVKKLMIAQLRNINTETSLKMAIDLESSLNV